MNKIEHEYIRAERGAASIDRLMWLETLCKEQHALLASVPFEPVTDDAAETNWHDRREAARQRYKALFARKQENKP